MIQYHSQPVMLRAGKPVPLSGDLRAAREKTMTYQILRAHDTGDGSAMRIRFDALVSHDITYVGIIQTARASGLTEFPVPYAMTNCHNSLCAVGGTINEDDHVFGLSAAKKYGGIYVPANQSVIHAYAREMLAGCGRMILGSDSHTRYGALGAMGVGEGGPELVKQLLGRAYELPAPEVVLCYVTGSPPHGVGPHDVALSLVRETFQSGCIRNKVLEFFGPGITSMSVDFRNGIDVMTTETACLSSIWATDGAVRQYYRVHDRPQAYAPLAPQEGAAYDACITIDLDRTECMIALPFHPSNAYPIREFLANAEALLAEADAEAVRQFPLSRPRLADKAHGGAVYADQGVIAGCAGGSFDNIVEAAAILKGGSIGSGAFSLSVYPMSVPVALALARGGKIAELLETGAIVKPSFCGPCFGAGDVPANAALSIRHTTRNFPNREGSKPGEGQMAAVALMDARSIAATARNGGRITAASEIDYSNRPSTYQFEKEIYQKRCYNGFSQADPAAPLVRGPNITDWPKQYPLGENLLAQLAAVIRDPVTTTDELIPSGETSSYRSNPLRLADFTLSRRAPDYVGRAKAAAALESERRRGQEPPALMTVLSRVGDANALIRGTQTGSCLFANKPGDGSAREQAASCQRVLGGLMNVCHEYATKRYRSNCINWGILPFTLPQDAVFPLESGDFIFVPGVRAAVERGDEEICATGIRRDGSLTAIPLRLYGLTPEDREILLEGCLMNHYAAQAKR